MESLFLDKSEFVDENAINSICKVFSELNPIHLRAELLHFKVNMQSDFSRFTDVISCFREMSGAQKSMYRECMRTLKLILTMPSTNAASERSFSTLRRIKTWLRTAIGQALFVDYSLIKRIVYYSLFIVFRVLAAGAMKLSTRGFSGYWFQWWWSCGHPTTPWSPGAVRGPPNVVF